MAAPLLQQTTPADNSTGVAVGANLILTYDQVVQAGSGVIQIRRVSDESLVKSIDIGDTSQISFSGNQVTINPTTDLPAGTLFYVVMTGGAVRNLASESAASISSATQFNFTTAGGGGDVTAPVRTATGPADNATGVGVNSNLTLTYNEAVQAGSGVIQIRRVSDESLVKSIDITDTTQVTFAGNQVTINPTTDLPANTAFYVVMTGGAVRDLANNDAASISSATAFNFTTAAGADTTAPVRTGTTPADNATGVSVSSNLGLTYNEAVQAGSGYIEIRRVSDESLVKSIAVTDLSQVSFSGNQVTINPTTDLPGGAAFYVTMTAGAVRDLAGNNAAGISTATAFNFTTVADTVAPTLTTTSPLDNATGVEVESNLVLTFNEAVKAGTGSIQIRKVSDGTIAKSIDITDATQVSFSGSEMTINPTTDLAGSTAYYVTFASGVVKDLANNNFAGISSSTAFNFTTASASDTTAPTLIATWPLDNAINVDAAEDFFLYFSEAVKAGSGNVEIRKVSDNSIVQSIAVTDGSQVSFSDSEMTISPTEALPGGYAYYITFGSGVIQDIANNPFAGLSSSTAFNFFVPNFITGTRDSDALNGGDGSDTINGQLGLDTLTGGAGDDTYIISNYEGGETSLHMYGEPGESLSSGRTLSFVLDPGQFAYLSTGDATGDDIVDTVYLRFFSDDEWWDLSFSTAQDDTNLLPGTYSGGVYVHSSSSANPVFGTFTVHAAEFDESPIPITLSISFEQHAYAPDSPALFGTFNYKYPAAGPATFDEIIEEPGDGIDTVLAAISYVLAPNVENLTLTGYAPVNATGNGLDNVIVGNIGDNTLDGGGGADEMAGGMGDDIYVVDNALDTVSELPDEGTDTVQSSITRSLEANVENLTLIGSANINGTGNGLDNVLTGNAGLNVLGGGLGNDTYVLGSGDSVLENSGQGQDTVESSVTQSLDDNVENLTLTGSNNINGTGNTLGNVLKGTYQILPGSGQNVLTGGDGDDTLNGLSGLDILIGGDGDDTYVINNYEGGENSLLLNPPPYVYGPRDAFSYLLAPEDLIIGLGDVDEDGVVDAIGFYYLNDDLQFWSISFSTYGIGENLSSGATYIDALRSETDGHPTLSVSGNGYGPNESFGSFTITALEIDYSDPENPVLESLSVTFEFHPESPDAAPMFGTLNYNYGLAGPATLDTIVEDVNEGVDTVRSALSYALGDNIENLILTDDGFNISGTGNSLANTIVGNLYDNVIDGAAGADTMMGGYGDDIYIVESLGDVVIEDIEYFSGTDTVQSSVTFVLGARLENLVLTGIGNINGSGNALDNTVTGNTGNNELSGGLGLDVLIGGGGNDTFRILAGTGSDTLDDFSVGVGVGDIVVLDGFTLGTFSAVQSAMTESGTDTILNLGGGQTLTFLNTSKNAFVADDFSFVNVQPSNPTPFTLPVSGAFTNTITGTRNVDNLVGSAANNRFDGRQGNDTMTGLAGDDTYLVDASGDNVVETSGNGIDTVSASAASYVLASEVENLTLTGNVTHTATGNGLNNLIIASSRPDIINGAGGNDIIRAGTGACVLTGGAGNDMFDFDVMGSQKQVTDFAVGQDLIDVRTLLAWYGGSNAVADNALSVTAVAGGVLVSVKASAGGALLGLVKITGVSVGDLDIGGDILWDS